MATKEELIRALRPHFPDLDDGLWVIAGTGRIMGFIASSRFEGEDHDQRQRRLWHAIDKAIPLERQSNIGPITTMVPEEADLHTAGEAEAPVLAARVE